MKRKHWTEHDQEFIFYGNACGAFGVYRVDENHHPIEVWPDYAECLPEEIERHEKWLAEKGYESEKPK